MGSIPTHARPSRLHITPTFRNYGNHLDSLSFQSHLHVGVLHVCESSQSLAGDPDPIVSAQRANTRLLLVMAPGEPEPVFKTHHPVLAPRPPGHGTSSPRARTALEDQQGSIAQRLERHKGGSRVTTRVRIACQHCRQSKVCRYCKMLLRSRFMHLFRYVFD